MNALEETSFEENPFALKRLGKFDQALHEYARYYVKAAELGDPFMEQQCFEQMFDLVLLGLYKEQLRARQERADSVPVAKTLGATRVAKVFKSRQELRQVVASQLKQALEQNQSFRHEAFDKAMAKCWQKFSPRGRGKNPFSVESGWLVVGNDHSEKTTS